MVKISAAALASSIFSAVSSQDLAEGLVALYKLLATQLAGAKAIPNSTAQ